MEAYCILFPLFYVAIWLGSLFFAAHFSGWSELAEKYCCENPYEGPKKGWQWGRFGRISYRNCLWIAMTTDGLYLETGPGFLFKVFHPPLLIPWLAIKSVQARKYWFMSVLEITLNESDVKLMLRDCWQSELQRFLGEKVKLINKDSQLIEN